MNVNLNFPFVKSVRDVSFMYISLFMKFEISSDKPSAFSSEKVMDKPIILIMGSSQGAEAINEMVLKTLSQLLEKYEIIHICGQKNYEKHKEKIGPTLPKEYHLYPFLREDQLRYGYTLADLIISRAGASSIFEQRCQPPAPRTPSRGQRR